MAGVSLRVTMLGTGTSVGVPVIGCDCPVCTSDDHRNKRLRPGLRLELERGVVLVDTPTDLRQQALRFGTRRVDAVLFTHGHADHILGLDDLRIYNFRQQQVIPCYGSADTLESLRRTFAYAFEARQGSSSKPRLALVEITSPFQLLGETVWPIPVFHGTLEVYGYRLGDFAYLTDCNQIPEASFRLLEGVKVLILDALRYRPHPTHFTVAEAVKTAFRIGAPRTILTHMTHDIDHAAASAELPEGVEFGYDGLTFELT